MHRFLTIAIGFILQVSVYYPSTLLHSLRAKDAFQVLFLQPGQSIC